MIIIYQVIKCPRCRRSLEAHFFYVRCGLGPPMVMCPRCRRPFNSGRKEWREMGTVGKIWFVAISLVYAAIFGSLIGSALYGLFAGNPQPGKTVGWGDVLPAVLLAGLAILGIQGYRLWASWQRSAREPIPYRPTFWSPHTNFQTKFIVMLLVAFVAYVIIAIATAK